MGDRNGPEHAEAERVKKWTQNIPALVETERYLIHLSKNGGHQSHNWANLAQKKAAK